MKIFFRLSVLMLALGGLATAANASSTSEKNAPCDIENPKNISGNIKLSPQCTYRGELVIRNSNVSIDCQGATFDGVNKTKFAIRIEGRGQPISNISIRNCKFINYSDTAILVTGLKKSEMSPDQQSNYKRSPSHIEIINIVAENSRRSGIFFDDYVFESSIKNSTIRGSGGPGIYLDQATHSIDIQNNTIESNGRTEGSKRIREGLAVDASAKNTIKSNKFINNGAGGIFLYKNCGEKFSSGKSILRWQSSNDNLIEDNTFINEKVAIWLASRQGRNLSNWDCGDRPVDAEKKYFEDYANHNAVKSNKFCGVEVAVKNSGDNNTVESNTFDADPKKMIIVPYERKPKPSGELSVGNISVNNTRSVCD